MNDRARHLLLGVFALGLVGLTTELLLLGHDEDMIQSIPLVLAGLALVSGAHVGVSRAAVAVRGFRVVMSLFIVGGVVGSALHFRANVEFQREMEPEMSRLALVQKALRAKAPPALAPGALIQLGLIGLVYTFRDPRLSRRPR